MARPLRMQYEGAFYHVMNRGNARQPIFRSREHYKIFINLLVESIALWEIRIHSFSLLPNHYHLFMETPRANLSRAMRHINGVYTQRFNRHSQRDGHLFRGRYKAILVEEDAYLVELVRYIHLNAVKAGLVTRPERYEWSSHRDYLKEGGRKWLSTGRVLSYFGKRRNLARRKFNQFVMEGVPEELQQRLDAARSPSVFSSKNFEEWIEWNFVKDIKDGDRGDVQYQSEHVCKVSLANLQKALCDSLDTSWKDIICPTSLKGR
ncbi:MAG: hypothetical protein COV46_00170, partial [Deltaproteobacteria bacterium CG11_big_fil_rev_8_21_14_0_20_49_13]